MFEDFQLVGRELFEAGLVSSQGGNLSIRRDKSIFITKRDVMLAHLKEDEIIEVPLEGSGERDVGASRELVVHRAIYRNTGAMAIVHAHPVYATALSLSESKIIPQDAEGSFFLRSIPVVRVREAIGSEEVAKMLPPIFSSNYVVAVIKGHGSFAAGGSLLEAYHYTSCLEKTCQIITISKSLEQKQKPKPQEQRGRRAIPPGIGVMDRGRRRDYRGRGGRR